MCSVLTAGAGGFSPTTQTRKLSSAQRLCLCRHPTDSKSRARPQTWAISHGPCSSPTWGCLNGIPERRQLLPSRPLHRPRVPPGVVAAERPPLTCSPTGQAGPQSCRRRASQCPEIITDTAAGVPNVHPEEVPAGWGSGSQRISLQKCRCAAGPL